MGLVQVGAVADVLAQAVVPGGPGGRSLKVLVSSAAALAAVSVRSVPARRMTLIPRAVIWLSAVVDTAAVPPIRMTCWMPLLSSAAWACGDREPGVVRTSGKPLALHVGGPSPPSFSLLEPSPVPHVNAVTEPQGKQ